MAIIYVYGTLRPGLADTVKIAGTLFNLGRFPGVKLDNGPWGIVCERITVDQKGLDRLDVYEGYDPHNPQGSLYIRRRLLDGFIYEFNHDVRADDVITSGDWLEYTKQLKGTRSDLIDL